MRKTFVWRYIVEDTVETKIDQKRTNQAATDNPTECHAGGGKGSGAINAGGIDGYFSTQAEILTLLRF
jgi:hypothetical protein